MSKTNIVICGQKYTGKSTIVLHATGKSIPNSYVPTIGVDYGSFKCKVGKIKLKMVIWDLAGDSRFSYVEPTFFQKAMLVVCVFDLTNQESFDVLSQYIEKANNNSAFIFVGTHSDQPQIINDNAIKEFSTLHSAPIYKINALEEAEVIILLHRIASECVEKGKYTDDDEKEIENLNARACCYTQ